MESWSDEKLRYYKQTVDNITVKELLIVSGRMFANCIPIPKELLPRNIDKLNKENILEEFRVKPRRGATNSGNVFAILDTRNVPNYTANEINAASAQLLIVIALKALLDENVPDINIYLTHINGHIFLTRQRFSIQIKQ